MVGVRASLVAAGVARLACHTAAVKSLTAVGYPVRFAPGLASGQSVVAIGALKGCHM